MNSFTKQLGYYLEFYKDFIVSSWDNITFWQYIALCVTVLIIGYLWMSKGAEGRT